MLKQIIVAFRVTLILLLIVSGLYPLVVWGVGQAAFRKQADGSLIVKDGKVIGSELLAQGFSKPQYFHPRPSAAGSGYDGTASGGTNLGPTSDKLISGAKGFDGVKQLAAAYRQENGLAENALVPVDAVTRSASGLDPDISVMNANVQAARVARARNLDENSVKKMIADAARGEMTATAHVNVLKLNLALDKR